MFDSGEIACLNGHATHICIIIQSSCDDSQFRFSWIVFCFTLKSCKDDFPYVQFSAFNDLLCTSHLFQVRML